MFKSKVESVISNGSFNDIFVKPSGLKSLKVIKQIVESIGNVSLYNWDKSNDIKQSVKLFNESNSSVTLVIDFGLKQFHVE